MRVNFSDKFFDALAAGRSGEKGGATASSLHTFITARQKEASRVFAFYWRSGCTPEL